MKFTPKPLTNTADISRGRVSASAVMKDVLSVALFLALSYVVLGWLGIAVAHWIPDRWEKKLAPVTSSILRDSDDLDLERAEGIFDRLLEGEVLRDLNYRLYAFRFPMPNAVAIPGGAVAVTPKLLEVVESERGLAFVLAHELGHHEHRHPLRALGRSLFLYAGAAMFGDAGTALQGALEVTECNFSREQERDADDFALRLVHRKYGGTDGALELFEWLVENENEPQYQKYFGTHPLSEDRIIDMKKLSLELSQAVTPTGAK